MPAAQASVGVMSFEDRIGEVMRRSLPRLGPEARAQVEAILSRESLLIIAGVLTAWVVSHAFGLGEIIDAILLAVGALALGWSIFEASITCTRSPKVRTSGRRLRTSIGQPSTSRRR